MELFELLTQRADGRTVNQSSMALLAHPGLAHTQLQQTTARNGGMAATSTSGDVYGRERWTGFPGLLPPEPELMSPENVGPNWEGCEAAAVGFPIQGRPRWSSPRAFRTNPL